MSTFILFKIKVSRTERKSLKNWLLYFSCSFNEPDKMRVRKNQFIPTDVEVLFMLFGF